MYDNKLNQILLNHNIELIDEDKLNDNLDLAVKSILTEKCASKRCALWGAGRMNTTSSHAAILIGKYATYMQNLICVIDSDSALQGKNFLGFPIISPNNITDYDIDIVIISSKNSGNSIVESLLDVSPTSDYVDIYEELKRKGIEVYNNFFDERSIYTQIFDLQEKYKNSHKALEKENCLKLLISYYLSIRDFYYSFFYIDRYVANEFTDFSEYLILKKEINDLLAEMKNKAGSRVDDISVFYVDALRAIDVFDLNTGEPKVLKKYIECSELYKNVYSTGVTTYESMVSAVLGKYPLECDVYSKNFLRDFNEVEFLVHAHEKGFNINWMVSDCYRMINENENLNLDLQIYMSKKLWNLSCKLVESEEKTFNFIYFPYEIHCPMLCGFHRKKPVIRGFSNIGIEYFPESIKNQYEDCLYYMDKQFEFYYDLIGKQTTKVIFSDHSQVVYDKDNKNKTYNMYYKNKELASHIPFIVSRNDQSFEIHDEYLSLINFNDIIISILKKTNLLHLKKEIIRYQYYPIHSAKIRLHAQKYDFNDYIDGMDIFVSKKYIYIITGTNKEELYEHSDLQTNLINTEEGRTFKNKVLTIYKKAF